MREPGRRLLGVGQMTLDIVPDADHIDVVTPGEAGWEAVRRATLTLLGLQPQPSD